MKAATSFIVMLLFAVAPQPARATLGFDEALGKIVQRSTGVQAQEYKSGATDAGYLPTELAYLPTLGVDAGWLNPGSSLSVYPSVVQPQTFLGLTQRQAEVQVHFNLFRFGSDWLAIKSAHLDEEAQAGLVEDQVLSAEKDGVAALVQVIQYQKQIAILADLVELQSSALSIAHERYKRGYLPQQEVDRLEVDLENARARKNDADIQEAQARAALVALLGSDDITADWPWRDALLNWKPPGDPVRVPPTPDLSTRPDWRSAQKELDSAESLHSSKVRLFFPTLDASVAAGTYSNQVGAPFTWGWSASLLVNFPLFDRLTAYANAKVQAYAVKQAEVALETVRRSARADWDSASAGFRLALSSARARDQVLGKSRSIYQDQVRRFEMGKITANDLAVDQRRFYDSELFAIQGWTAVHLNLAQLCHARGVSLSRNAVAGGPDSSWNACVSVTSPSS